jgi:hypothetical protein
MRKEHALSLFGNNASELARVLGIKPQAVYQWGECIPELRAYQLREKRPDLFFQPYAPQTSTAPEAA